jgi:hypothetical protein
LQGEKFDLLLEELSPLSCPNIWNQTNNPKIGNGGKGSIDQILKFKRKCCYNYIQDNIFHGQGSLKSFLFKMSTHGPTSDVDTMRWEVMKND